jgi:hypothetical protein
MTDAEGEVGEAIAEAIVDEGGGTARQRDLSPCGAVAKLQMR